jgi:hypothetical protein
VSCEVRAKKHREESLETKLKSLEKQGLIRLAKQPMGKFRPLPSRGKSAAKMILEDRG